MKHESSWTTAFNKKKVSLFQQIFEKLLSQTYYLIIKKNIVAYDEEAKPKQVAHYHLSVSLRV